MITASDFRKGMTFDINGEPHVVLDFQHVKPGKGAAFVRTKYRNILTGATREEAFNPSDKFEQAHIETKKMQYLYNDGELYYFMDPENYDQVPLSFDLVEDAIKYIKENDARLQGRHGYRSFQARYRRDRSRDTGTYLHRRGRKDPDRHQDR